MMKKNFFLKLIISSIVFLYSMSAQPVEFNQQAFSIFGSTDIDLTTFESNSYAEGKYFASVVVNNKLINNTDEIDFAKKDENITACVSYDLVKKFGLKESFIKNIPSWNSGKCLDLAAVDENIKVNFSDEEQILYLSIPQIYFLYEDDDWIPPEQREYGINGLVFDYNFIDNYISNDHSPDSHNINVMGTVGANVHEWRFRSNYQYQRYLKPRSYDHFEWVETYVFRDLSSINSKLFLGQYYISSNLYDSVRFIGASIYSDDNMLPALLRGYAPRITGIASSNATVTISQDGRVLTQVKVSAGPFSINNLSSSISGTIDVKVTEEDGSVNEYQVSTINIPFLTRQGSFQYKINFGQLDPLGYDKVNSGFVSGELSWGAFNNISFYGGLFTTTNSEYYSLTSGVGLNLEQFGALSFDATKTANTVSNPNGKKEFGISYRINYAKRFTEDTELYLSGYQFSNQNYMSVNRYISESSGDSWGANQEKNVYSISFNQRLPHDLSLNFTMSKITYWDKTESNDFYNVILNKIINNSLLHNATASLTFSNGSYSNNKRNNQVYLSLNIPLGYDNTSSIKYFGYYSDSNHRYKNSLSYYDRIAGNNISLGVTDDFHRDKSVNGSIYRDTPYGTFQLSGAYNKDYTSFGASADGSITITEFGPVLQKRVYSNQSRMIIDVDKANNVSINNNQAVTNRFGLAGLSNIPNYYRSSNYVDLNNLPKNVNIDNNIVEVALTDGAIGYRKIDSTIGEKGLIVIKLEDDRFPPFGAIVVDEKGKKELGMISDGGEAYLTGIRQGQKLIVKWGIDKSCHIKMASFTEELTTALICYED